MHKMAATLFPKLVLFGDSLTQESFSPGGWGAAIADHFQRKCDVLNRGFSGYTTAYNKLILPRILKSDNTPKGSVAAAVVLLGSNDTVVENLDPRGLTLEQYTTNLSDVLSQFMDSGIPASQLVLLTPPAVSEDMHREHCLKMERVMCLSDARVNSFAEGCVGLGRKLRVDVVDLYSLFHKQPNWEQFLSDGLHFSEEGGRFVAKQVIPLLETKLGHLKEVFPDWKDIDPLNPEQACCNFNE